MAKRKILKLLLGIFPVFTPLFASDVEQVSFQKLPSTCIISYGDPSAPIHVNEYFSFSCPKCMTFIRRDFATIEEKYIDTGKVYWTFHPDPADLLTLQGMICLKRLTVKEKQIFLENIATFWKGPSIKKTSFKMQELMNSMGKAVPSLHDLSFIEHSKAFQEAFTYLKQKEAPIELPTIEINGHLYEEFPSLEWINKVLKDLHMKLKEEKLVFTSDYFDTLQIKAAVVVNQGLNLKKTFPNMKGVALTNSKYMCQFAKEYPDFPIGQQAVGQVPWGHNIILIQRVL